MTLFYPAYLYWPSAQAFYQIISNEDLTASFAWNDLHEEELTGWDAIGRRFFLAWNEVLGCAEARIHGPDYEGLAATAHLFYSLRKDDESYFAEGDVVDGECSIQAIRRFCEFVLLKPPAQAG